MFFIWMRSPSPGHLNALLMYDFELTLQGWVDADFLYQFCNTDAATSEQ